MAHLIDADALWGPLRTSCDINRPKLYSQGHTITENEFVYIYMSGRARSLFPTAKANERDGFIGPWIYAIAKHGAGKNYCHYVLT